VRNIIIQGAPAVWTTVMEHDMHGEELQQFIGETGDSNEYGGERQIAIFAAIKRLKVTVHDKTMGKLTYGHGHEFHLLYSHINDENGEPNHYDLLEDVMSHRRLQASSKKAGDTKEALQSVGMVLSL